MLCSPALELCGALGVAAAAAVTLHGLPSRAAAGYGFSDQVQRLHCKLQEYVLGKLLNGCIAMADINRPLLNASMAHSQEFEPSSRELTRSALPPYPDVHTIRPGRE